MRDVYFFVFCDILLYFVSSGVSFFVVWFFCGFLVKVMWSWLVRNVWCLGMYGNVFVLFVIVFVKSLKVIFCYLGSLVWLCFRKFLV